MFWRKERRYILSPRKMRGFPYLSSKKKRIVSRETTKVWALAGIRNLTSKTHIKVKKNVKTWNDPMVFMDMLPQMVAPKAIIEFSHKCWFPNVRPTSDPRSMKSEDSWIRVKSFAPSMVIVATNFYCMSSAATQREFTEDILLMARARAKDNQLNFHEPRRREHQQL